jgi:hypothetical protein
VGFGRFLITDLDGQADSPITECVRSLRGMSGISW